VPELKGSNPHEGSRFLSTILYSQIVSGKVRVITRSNSYGKLRVISSIIFYGKFRLIRRCIRITMSNYTDFFGNFWDSVLYYI
jgi:hypothetical protein